jgi:hypothetical protein
MTERRKLGRQSGGRGWRLEYLKNFECDSADIMPLLLKSDAQFSDAFFFAILHTSLTL